jgi:hypothetical protein
MRNSKLAKSMNRWRPPSDSRRCSSLGEFIGQLTESNSAAEQSDSALYRPFPGLTPTEPERTNLCHRSRPEVTIRRLAALRAKLVGVANTFVRDEHRDVDIPDQIVHLVAPTHDRTALGAGDEHR